jgi:hypothetical protein
MTVEVGMERFVFMAAHSTPPPPRMPPLAMRSTAPGAPHLHFHDLHHTGNALAAGPGCARRTPWRGWHTTARGPALIYQHASARADRAIANALSALV